MMDVWCMHVCISGCLSIEWIKCMSLRYCVMFHVVRSNFIQHQALSALYQKCWINISYQSKIVVAYGLLSSTNKTHAPIETNIGKLILLLNSFLMLNFKWNGMKIFYVYNLLHNDRQYNTPSIVNIARRSKPKYTTTYINIFKSIP